MNRHSSLISYQEARITNRSNIYPFDLFFIYAIDLYQAFHIVSVFLNHPKKRLCWGLYLL